MSKMLLLTSVLLLAAGAIFLATRCGWLGCGKSTVDLDAYRKDGWFGKSVPGNNCFCVCLKESLFYNSFAFALQLASLCLKTTRRFDLSG